MLFPVRDGSLVLGGMLMINILVLQPGQEKVQPHGEATYLGCRRCCSDQLGLHRELHFIFALLSSPSVNRRENFNFP